MASLIQPSSGLFLYSTFLERIIRALSLCRKLDGIIVIHADIARSPRGFWFSRVRRKGSVPWVRSTILDFMTVQLWPT